jgi:hypothetical protein
VRRQDVRKVLILFLFFRSTKARTKNTSPKSDVFSLRPTGGTTKEGG